MRNPLNSILAMISKIKYVKEQMQATLLDPGIPQETKKVMKVYMDEFTSSTRTLESSTKLLNLSVHDMLSLAQIESSKFRKIVSVFDIRESVKEVMEIQREKADYNKIDFKV